MITTIIPIFHFTALVLFDLGSTYSCVLTYFTVDIDFVYEPLAVPIRIPTPIGESLDMDWVHQGCVVIFSSRETCTDLILVDD